MGFGRAKTHHVSPFETRSRLSYLRHFSLCVPCQARYKDRVGVSATSAMPSLQCVDWDPEEEEGMDDGMGSN